MQIRYAKTEDIALIHHLAQEIWPISYKDIITQGQITYMLKLMYSHDALSKQMCELNHRFILISDNALNDVGFASFSPKLGNENILWRLHKLYVLPKCQGMGYGKKMVDFIAESIKAKGAHTLELNVNKRNPAFQFYQRLGFSTTRQEVIDIGNGYVMDDFVMAKEI